tara:strand:+ start:1666 stop:2853 length:1188 start_codon:yes stop_codon:yes gene_type:complete
MRYLILLLLTLSLFSCGPLNTINSNSSDGIYGNNVDVASNNSAFYKNYFEQKSDELGINSSINDSVLTDINSYSSNTNISYTNSNGSWGDNPSSVNIIFRDRYVYQPYMNYYPNGYNWYDNYISNSWNRWYSPWGFNYPRYGNGYGNRYGYGYGIWNNWWHPYYNGPDYNDPYYYRNDNRVAYMNGKRSSLYSTDKGILDNSSSSNSTTNYNVGRNDSKIVKSKTGGKDEKLEQLKNRNINRVYYALKNGQGRVGPARGYQNRGEIVNYGNSGSDSKSRSKSNFQASKYGSNTRSYDVSRSSKGSLNKNRGYSRSEINNTNSSSNSRSYSRPENNSNSSSGQAKSYSRPSSNSNKSSSSSSRSNYTPSSSTSRSSVGNVSSGSSSRSGSVSRSKR